MQRSMEEKKQVISSKSSKFNPKENNPHLFKIRNFPPCFGLSLIDV